MYGSFWEEMREKFVGSPVRIGVTVISILIFITMVCLLFIDTPVSERGDESAASSNQGTLSYESRSADQVNTQSVDETLIADATTPEHSQAPSNMRNQSIDYSSPAPANTTPLGANDYQRQSQPPAQPAGCNEAMKMSYTNLYNSKVSAENASWANQINAWNSYAAGNGMAFSGYVQGMVNDNKPAHDARLAQHQAQYHQNLVSINCQP